jgi:hypothetical protein
LEGSAQAASSRFKRLHVKPFEQTETDQAGANKIDRYHEIEEPRHDQNQNAGDQGHDGGNVGSGDRH